MAVEHNIHLFCLPPHTTHRLQPLDVGVFGPFQRKWADRCDDVLDETGEEIRRADFVKEYMGVRKQTFLETTIRKAWEQSGIRPLNPGIFTERDFAPSFVTSTHAHVPSGYPDDPSPSHSDDSLADCTDESESDTQSSSSSESSDSDDNSDDDAASTTSSDSNDSADVERDNTPVEDTRGSSSASFSGGQGDRTGAPSMRRTERAVSSSTDGYSGCLRVQPSTPPPSMRSESHDPSQPGPSQAHGTFTHHVNSPSPFKPHWSLQRKFQALENENAILREQVASLASELRSAKAHCTYAKVQIGDLQKKLNAKLQRRQAKSRRNFVTEERWLTSGPALAQWQREEDARLAEERRKAEARQQREEEDARRAERRVQESSTAVYSGSLGSKKKADLQDIAYALDLSITGKKDDLLALISTHLKDHPEREADPRFAGLYLAMARGQKRRAPAADHDDEESRRSTRPRLASPREPGDGDSSLTPTTAHNVSTPPRALPGSQHGLADSHSNKENTNSTSSPIPTRPRPRPRPRRHHGVSVSENIDPILLESADVSGYSTAHSTRPVAPAPDLQTAARCLPESQNQDPSYDSPITAPSTSFLPISHFP